MTAGANTGGHRQSSTAVNTQTAAPLRTKRMPIRRFAQAVSRGKFVQTTDCADSRSVLRKLTQDPASRRAGRSALSSVRPCAPAARMKQQERRQADPGAAHNAGLSKARIMNGLPNRCAAMAELDRAALVTARNAERESHALSVHDAGAPQGQRHASDHRGGIDSVTINRHAPPASQPIVMARPAR